MRWCVCLLLLGLPLLSQPDRARQFVDALTQEDFSVTAGFFDDNLKRLLPAEQLAATWKQLQGRAGKFVKQAGTRQEKAGNFDVFFVACAFEHEVLDVKVVLNTSGQVAGLFFVPHVDVAQPPASIVESAAVVNGLPGTLTLPKAGGPFRAVVLVHGSGPEDRDETIGPNKPFRDLAWGLAARGIAVLRYDKRTFVHPEQFASGNVTVKEETIEDALAAVAGLRRTPRIDPHRVFVLGHSLGGTLVPRIGLADPKIAGFIIMAGSARAAEDVIVEQMEYLAAKNLDEVRMQAARLKDLKPGDGPVLGAPASYWIDLRGYDPPSIARELRQPMLILQGGRDYQVTPRDFGLWKQALAGRRNVRYKTYPALNHLFLPGEGKSTPAEYQKPGHIPDEVIADIANWISGH